MGYANYSPGLHWGGFFSQTLEFEAFSRLRYHCSTCFCSSNCSFWSFGGSEHSNTQRNKTCTFFFWKFFFGMMVKDLVSESQIRIYAFYRGAWFNDVIVFCFSSRPRECSAPSVDASVKGSVPKEEQPDTRLPSQVIKSLSSCAKSQAPFSSDRPGLKHTFQDAAPVVLHRRWRHSTSAPWGLPRRWPTQPCAGRRIQGKSI